MLSRLLVLSSSSSAASALRPAVAWLAGHAAGSHTHTKIPNNNLRLTALGYSTSAAEDESAVARSRAPFRMPRNSADDSVPQKNVPSWNQLGLWTELVDALTRDMKLAAPTPVQGLVIPSLLKQTMPDTAFLAATGSG
jgi:hypothetical protein